MSFGLTNGVAGFQKSMHNFISDEKLDTFAFMDNIVRCCMTQNDHDESLGKFQEAARCWNLTFNTDKYTFWTTSLSFIG